MEAGYWSRIEQARISRRRTLAGATGLVAAGALYAAVGCTGDDGKSAPATETPRRGGTLRTGVSLPLSSGLDPQIERGSGLEIFPRVYGYLFHVDPRDDSTILDHALSVEQPDATTIVVALRDDVHFQDIAPVSGRTVTASDAVASIGRFRDNPLAINKLWHAQVLDSATAVDPTHLHITLKRPDVYSLSRLGAIDAGAIIPRELVDAGSDLSESTIGSGPFRIDDVDRTRSVRLARHDAYFRQPLPYLDAMEWRFFDDDEAKVSAMRSHDVDLAPNRDRREADGLHADNSKITIASEPGLSYLSLGLRVDRPPFNDPRVREAIDVSLDRDAMIRDIAFGEGDILGPVNPHLAGGYWSLPTAEVAAAQGADRRPDERRAAARAVFDEAGIASQHIRLQVAKIPQLLDVAGVVRDQLQRAGLIVDLETLDFLRWFLNFRRGDFDMTLISQLPYEFPDGPARFYHSQGPDGSGNPFGFADPAIDALLERAWAEADRPARSDLLIQAQRLMIAARPMLQLFTSRAYASGWDNVHDWQHSAPGSLAQYDYGQWVDPA